MSRRDGGLKTAHSLTPALPTSTFFSPSPFLSLSPFLSPFLSLPFSLSLSVSLSLSISPPVSLPLPSSPALLWVSFHPAPQSAAPALKAHLTVIS